MSNNEDVTHITFSDHQVGELLKSITDGLKSGKEIAVSASMILDHGDNGYIKYEIITSNPVDK